MEFFGVNTNTVSSNSNLTDIDIDFEGTVRMNDSTENRNNENAPEELKIILPKKEGENNDDEKNMEDSEQHATKSKSKTINSKNIKHQPEIVNISVYNSGDVIFQIERGENVELNNTGEGKSINYSDNGKLLNEDDLFEETDNATKNSAIRREFNGNEFSHRESDDNCRESDNGKLSSLAKEESIRETSANISDNARFSTSVEDSVQENLSINRELNDKDLPRVNEQQFDEDISTSHHQEWSNEKLLDADEKRACQKKVINDQKSNNEKLLKLDDEYSAMENLINEQESLNEEFENPSEDYEQAYLANNRASVGNRSHLKVDDKPKNYATNIAVFAYPNIESMRNPEEMILAGTYSDVCTKCGRTANNIIRCKTGERLCFTCINVRYADFIRSGCE